MAANLPVAVCERCFEFEERDISTAKGPLLIEKKCLHPSAHKDAMKVRVCLKDGVLEPEIRPMPKVHFRGEFKLCSESGRPCRGLDKCSYAHCLKEKAAWNAEKFFQIKC